MNSLKFSVIIPTYNRANTIKRCLDSVVQQSYGNWEAIVVDNFSEDKTEEIVRSYNDARIKYYKNHNYGIIAVSRNYAIDRATGDWICFLDSDDSWSANKLEQLLLYTNDYDLIYHGYQTNIPCRSFFHKRDKIYFYSIKEPNVAYVLKRGDPISTSCSAVSKAFLSDIRFDESQGLFAIEDYDFYLQIISRAPRIKHLKKCLAYYDETTGISHDKLTQLNRNRAIFKKYQPYLTKEEFRDVLKYYFYLRGLRYLQINKRAARDAFRVAMTTPAWFIKKRAIVGYLSTFFR